MTETARRPGGRTARVRRTVLDAVLAELAEHGYDGLSVDGVAARAGVHRGTVYRRWTDVGGLLADALHAAREQDWRPADTGSLAGDLAALNREVWQALTAAPSVAAAVVAASFRSPQAARALREFWAQRYQRGAQVVARAVDRGEIAGDVAPERVLLAASGPVFHALVLLGAELSAADAEQYGRDAAAAYCKD